MTAAMPLLTVTVAGLLASAGPGAVVLVVAVAVTLGIVVRARVACGRLRRERDEAAARAERLAAERTSLAAHARQAGGDLEASAMVLARQKAKTDSLRATSRALEAILAVTARFGATRQLPELVRQIADAATDTAGFDRATVHLWSDATVAYEVREARGLSDAEIADLGAHPVSAETYSRLTDHRFRHWGCFLVRGSDESVAPTPLPAGGGWRPDMRLIVPLVAAGGDTLGFLDLGEPRDGRVPGRARVRQLEFLARQAATSVESAEVYERLARNNAELSQASEKLGSLADMKANFVANVSHELRTPLTSISAYTEMLQQNLATMPPESLDEFLKVIHSEARKLTGVINDILDLSQMENGRPSLNRAETDIAALVRRLEDGWRSRALEADLTLAVEVPEEPVPLAFDAVLVQQLLTHLLTNAFKFTPAGGRVTVRLEEAGTALRLTVDDTGIGIPEDKLGAIFDKFYQVDGSATREHNGQGVGLAICHDIVSHHDGRIWAENIEPQGSRFTVLLPRRPAVVQPVASPGTTGRPFEPGEFMQRVMHWIAESIGVQTVTLMEPDPDGEHLRIRASIGLSEAVVQGVRVRRGAGIAGRVWSTGESLLLADVTRDPRFGRAESEPRYSTPSLLCVPLQDKGEVVGLVSVNNRADGRALDDDDRLFLEALAPRLVEILARHDSWIERSGEFHGLRESLRATTAVGHLRQESLLAVCQEICLATARRVALPEEELGHLAFALQFYDVGMSCVPPQLLGKPEPLAPDEERLMRGHVEAGLEILDALRPAARARQIILHHHENHDGSGYPGGLAGEAIPLGARLVRLSDTLAALLSPRPWREAHDLDAVKEHIAGGSGVHFCPRLTDVFLLEAEARRERIEALQRRGGEARDLARPVLDRRGMVTIT